MLPTSMACTGFIAAQQGREGVFSALLTSFPAPTQMHSRQQQRTHGMTIMDETTASLLCALHGGAGHAL